MILVYSWQMNDDIHLFTQVDSIKGMTTSLVIVFVRLSLKRES